MWCISSDNKEAVSKAQWPRAFPAYNIAVAWSFLESKHSSVSMGSKLNAPFAQRDTNLLRLRLTYIHNISKVNNIFSEIKSYFETSKLYNKKKSMFKKLVSIKSFQIIRNKPSSNIFINKTLVSIFNFFPLICDVLYSVRFSRVCWRDSQSPAENYE